MKIQVINKNKKEMTFGKTKVPPMGSVMVHISQMNDKEKKIVKGRTVIIKEEKQVSTSDDVSQMSFNEARARAIELGYKFQVGKSKKEEMVKYILEKTKKDN